MRMTGVGASARDEGRDLPGKSFVGSWGFILGLPPIEADDGTPESNPRVLNNVIGN